MGKWETVRLGGYIEQIRGISYSPEDTVENEDATHKPVLRAHNIQSNGLNTNRLVYVKEKKIKEIQYIKKGDIVVCASSGSKDLVGKAAQATTDMEASFGAFCKVVRPKETINPTFLKHYFSSPYYRHVISDVSAGANINNLRNEHINNLEIPLPPLDVQQKIADALDKASALIELRKVQLEKLDMLIKSRFIEMFGDPVTNPKGWPSTELGRLGEWGSGGTPSRTNKQYFEGNINWYSAGELNSFILSESAEKITLDAIKETSAKIFPANSLFVGMYDTAAFKLSITPISASANQACANISPNLSMTHIYWLFYCLQTMRPFFLENRRGIRQKNLNLGMIKGFVIPLPPISLQNEYAAFVERVEVQKKLLQRSLAKLELNYTSLMQKCFRGEVF